jgi:hypothetical protein
MEISGSQRGEPFRSVWNPAGALKIRREISGERKTRNESLQVGTGSGRGRGGY